MSDPPTETRRGARTPSLVPAEIVDALSDGETSTVNFMEQFALDLDRLVECRLPEVRPRQRLMDLSLKARLTQAGRLLAEVSPQQRLYERVANEPDTVRAVAAFAAVHAEDSGASAALVSLRPFADDPHFSVREWAWIALRDRHGDAVVDLVPDLARWAADPSPNIRRFGSEVLRSRGVWSRHLGPVRADPEIASPVIGELRADPHRYVQLSVGNWLNDAGKDHPRWVSDLCASWLSNQPAASTKFICRRGLRNLR